MQCMSKTSLMWCCLWLLTIVVVMMEQLVHCVRVCVCVCVWYVCVTDTHTRTHNHIVAFCPGLPGWAGTRRNTPTHTYPDQQTLFYQLPPSTTIHSILCVQFTCLTVLFHNLSPGPLWSPSWSWTLCSSTSYSIHSFTQSSCSFCNTCPYQRNLFAVVPMLCHLFHAEYVLCVTCWK